jgi:hypothetical protein
VVVRFAVVVVVAFGADVLDADVLDVLLAAGFFFVEVVDVWGVAAHAPMARVTDNAAVSGSKVSRKNSV